MKKTNLLLILIFSFCISKGQVQKWNSVVLQRYVDSTGLLPANVDLASLHLSTAFPTKEIPDNDTLKVIMLMSDTSSYEYMMADGSKQIHMNGFMVYYTYGYKVYDYKNEEILYLDEQKKRLPKSVIVWEDVEK